ncbi:MerR family DNA-binding transcriptional regulator [Enterococcus mundtii]|nr:MerR family DNA-binding transcriptional regulator [Enterococcus mundtii]
MKRLYSIGEVSELLDIPRSTIRYWDAEGLIHAAREEENGYRLFDIDAIFKYMTSIFIENSIFP